MTGSLNRAVQGLQVTGTIGQSVQVEQDAPARTPFYVMALERRKAIKERVQRHTDHLEALVQTLRKLGVDGPAINQLVAGISKTYQSELLRSIDRI